MLLRTALFTAAALSALAAQAAPEPDAVRPSGSESVTFVACPVYRNTDAGPKSGCWLATNHASGTRYDVSFGRTKPQIGREVLVEGLVTPEPDVCGGVVLTPVRVSVLETRCAAFILPAEGFAGRRFAPPAETMQPTDVPRPVPPPPYESREFVIEFDMHSDFLSYQYSELILERAAQYVKASKPRQVTVTGYAAARAIEASDRRLAEDPSLAEKRALMVAEALRRLGIPSSILKTQWSTDPPPAAGAQAGLEESSKRRATISLQL